jgi:superfamily I DNA/RNA helicase
MAGFVRCTREKKEAAQDAPRAKGLEASRVWLLERESNNGKKSAWQHQQERNLRYVALTRSKQFLGLVNPN